MSEKPKETCPFCKRKFVSLARHKKCEKRDKALSVGIKHEPEDENAHGVECGNSTQTSGVLHEKETVPYSHRQDVSLDNHTECEKLDKAPSVDVQPESESVDFDSSYPKTSNLAGARGKRKETCPFCNRKYSSLQKHQICEKRDKALEMKVKATTERTSQEGEKPNLASGQEKLMSDSKRSTALERHMECRKKDKTKAVSSFDDGSNYTSNSHLVDVNDTVTSKMSKELTKAAKRNTLSDQDISKLDEFVERLVLDRTVEKCGNPKGEVLNFFEEEVKLRRKEMSVASGFFNPLVLSVCKYLKGATGWEWEQLKTGSYYDGTKVSRPNEMDCMFVPKLQGLKVCTDGAPLGFCFVNFEQSIQEDLRPFCEGTCLSSSKFRSYVFQCLDRFEKRRVKRDTSLGEGSPSYCLINDTGLGDNDSKLVISMDLVPALHFPGWPSVARDLNHVVPDNKKREINGVGFHVVAKDYNGDDCQNKHLLWRLSFSASEKILTKSADSISAHKDKGETCKTYRKPVLRTLKRVLEIVKDREPVTEDPKGAGSAVAKTLHRAAKHVKGTGYGVEEHKFTTFQLRTLMWNEFYVSTLGDHVWGIDSRLARLSMAMRKLKRMLTGQLPMEHFFLPKFDIMADVPREEREYLYIMVSMAEEILL